MMSSRSRMMVVSSSAALVVVLLCGAVIGKSASTDEPFRHLGVFSEVLSRIKSDYVEEPDIKNVTLGAVNGMLESIDPYASYLNADQYKQYLKNRDAKRADVGLILAKRYGYIGVVDSIPGSPAAKAGLNTNDLVESINGIATRDMPLAFAEMLLQGDAGSSVELSVMRVSKPEPTKLTLNRAMLKMPAVVKTMLADQTTGVVSASTLQEGRVANIQKAVEDLQRQGAKRLVLDLRNNASGTPEEGIALANLFLEKGTVTYLQGQRTPRKDFTATGKVAWRLPLVVISNRGTANGAEVAVAALLDNKRAEVVGEKTFGDAALRKAIELEDGSAVILSVAKYYSPGGKAIQDAGVIPSVPMIEVETSADAVEDDNAPAEPKQSTEDTLLKKAVEIVTKGAPAQAGVAQGPAVPANPLSRGQEASKEMLAPGVKP